MAPIETTDPALANTPVPLDGDGSELIGSVIDGRYRLEATLGRGGMGLVFRATHIGLRRQVAVKILHPSLAASPEVKNRFEREALAVGKVDHPNCVATYDVGRLPDGALYLAMELLEGKSLADVLEAEGQLAAGRALHILAHILRGLGAVHAAGLIHRDIKPENIFLIRQGDDLDFAKILDFGIAKPMSGELSDDGVRLTKAGMAFGTPIYMAPEQALGNPMDGRADLYAAAVIGYEMLCGQPPFYSEDKLEVMSMHTAKPVPPMRTRLIKRGRPVPSSLERIMMRGLTKKPNDRYASAEVFLAAVEEALHTPDGGQTDVSFERPQIDTGSQPLVDDRGQLNFDDDQERPDINSAIEEAIAISPIAKAGAHASPAGAGVPGRAATPNRGISQRPSIAPLPSTHGGGGTTLPAAALPGGATLHARDATPGTGVMQRTAAQRESARVATKIGVEPPVVAAGEPRGRAAGGVGIGLPYTGPQGEPIFGLTPEQRLAQVPRKRWPLYAGIAAAAIVAGVAIAILTKPKDEAKLDPSTPAGQANEALDRGDPGKALAILETAAKTQPIDKDPDAQLVLGHAHAARHESAAALDAYRHALALAPDLESDKELRANLRSMAAEKTADVVANAFDVWVGLTKDAEARPALLNAVKSESLDRRHAVIPVIEKLKLGDDVDWVYVYTLDLDATDTTTCEIRKEAVAKLRALGDPRGADALNRAIKKKIKSGPMRGKPVNGCLIDDAISAIGYLDGLKKK